MKRVITSILIVTFIVTGVALAAADGQPTPKMIGADDGTGSAGQYPGNKSTLYLAGDKQAPAATMVGPAFETSYPFGTTINLSGSFTDNGGTHTATWTIGGNVINGTVD